MLVVGTFVNIAKP